MDLQSGNHSIYDIHRWTLQGSRKIYVIQNLHSLNRCNHLSNHRPSVKYLHRASDEYGISDSNLLSDIQDSATQTNPQRLQSNSAGQESEYIHQTHPCGRKDHPAEKIFQLRYSGTNLRIYKQYAST